MSVEISSDKKKGGTLEDDNNILCTTNQVVEVVKAENEFMSEDEDDNDENSKKPLISGEEEFQAVKKTEATQALIRAGMGASLGKKVDHSTGIEVVKSDKTTEEDAESIEGDDRLYDSDHEDYDLDDRAKDLALGSMMLRRSKAKQIIDASYNRFAWNDQADLPDWFMDDEEKNYRPQVDIPRELIDQMREKFMSMATKPVKKVAEARMRKKRQLNKKVNVAKKKATEIANLPDMSTQEKLKSIDKAMRGAQVKKPSKVYVVSTRGGRKSAGEKKKMRDGGGKIKFVDARMKNDMRNTKRKKRQGKK